MNSGFVYVLANKAMPGLLKVGFSRRSPEQRAAELWNTAVPVPFTVVFSTRVSDATLCEREVHRKLHRFRATANREFFRVSFEAAVGAINDVCARFALFVEQSGDYEDDSRAFDCDLSPWAQSEDAKRYFAEAAKYYPGISPSSVATWEDDGSTTQTWFADHDFRSTGRGHFVCSHCGSTFEFCVDLNRDLLPPVCLPCRVCGRNIFTA